jgi:hypothetical protein
MRASIVIDNFDPIANRQANHWGNCVSALIVGKRLVCAFRNIHTEHATGSRLWKDDWLKGQDLDSNGRIWLSERFRQPDA